jgi:hypothetical protein
MNGGHEFLNHQYFSIFFWRHIHIDTQSQRLAPDLYLILLFAIHWLIGRKDTMYSGDITLPFDQTTCSSFSVIVFQTMYLFIGIFQILFSVNLDINLINMYCKEMPISVSNVVWKKTALDMHLLCTCWEADMLDLYSSIVSCLQVVHLFGSDKVYIHYGTFQFLSNAFITKPCVYDMKKVIICFITNVA